MFDDTLLMTGRADASPPEWVTHQSAEEPVMLYMNSPLPPPTKKQVLRRPKRRTHGNPAPTQTKQNET